MRGLLLAALDEGLERCSHGLEAACGTLPGNYHKLWQLQIRRARNARDAGGEREDLGADNLAAAW